MDRFFADDKKELLDGLMDMLREHAPGHYAGYAVASFSSIPAYVYDEGPDSPWYLSEDARYLAEDLKDILQEHAPDGYYFGNHPDNIFEWGYFPIA